MKSRLYLNNVFVKKSRTHGYGVFAGKTIRKGEKIEECYFLYGKRRDLSFEDYYFDAKGKYALLMGFGSIYNHADEPNADYTFNVKKRIATFKAEKTIHKGEEIFISYGDDWFSTRGKKAKKT